MKISSHFVLSTVMCLEITFLLHKATPFPAKELSKLSETEEGDSPYFFLKGLSANTPLASMKQKMDAAPTWWPASIPTRPSQRTPATPSPRSTWWPASIPTRPSPRTPASPTPHTSWWPTAVPTRPSPRTPTSPKTWWPTAIPTLPSTTSTKNPTFPTRRSTITTKSTTTTTPPTTSSPKPFTSIKPSTASPIYSTTSKLSTTTTDNDDDDDDDDWDTGSFFIGVAAAFGFLLLVAFIAHLIRRHRNRSYESI